MTRTTQRALGRGGARIQSVVFFLSIWLPLLFTFGALRSDVSESEQRRLAERPSLSWAPASWRSFPVRAERFYDDHMGFRLPLIRAHAISSIEWMGRSPAPKLIVGRDGWFFLGDDAAVRQYQGAAALGPEELRAWREFLLAQRDELARVGIQYLVVFVPNKHSIYPEKMPDHIAKLGTTQPLTQLVEDLAAHTDLAFIDLRPTLLEAKRHRRVYHKTDTHWNDIGAYAAYREIHRVVTELMPGFLHREPVKVVRARATLPGMGLAKLVGLSNRYPEQTTLLRPREPESTIAPEFRASYDVRNRRREPVALGVGDPNLPRIVFFRDSFGEALIPYLSESFQRILFAWGREVDPRVIEIERPDLVVVQIVERFIDVVPKVAERPGAS